MKTYVILFCFIMQAAIANATRYFWVGGTSGDWNNSANWAVSSGTTGLGIPGPSDEVVFDKATPFTCVLNTKISVASVTISGGSLSLDAAADVTVNGPFNISAGTFDAGAGILRIASDIPSAISGGMFNANQAFIYLNASLNVFNSQSFQPGTSTISMSSGSYTVTLNDNNNPGKPLRFYNLVIGKQLDVETATFNSTVASDSFQVDNLLTLANGQIAGNGFWKIEKDLMEASTFDGASISIACTGANAGKITLGAPLAAGGYNSFVGIAKSTPLAVVSVYRGSDALDDTIRIGNGGNFTVRNGIIQFPDNSPIVSYFDKLIIELGGTFKSTSNYFYNKGGHVNKGGSFLHNNGTYVFVNTNTNYTEFANHVENFYNLKLACSRIEPKSNDTLVIDRDLTLLTGVISGASCNGASVVLKGDVVAFADAPANYLESLNIIISGSGNQHFFNVNTQNVDFFNCPITIDKPSGQVVLDAPFFISGWGAQALIFKSGIIRSSSEDNYLQMYQGTISGASNKSHVDGPFKYQSGWNQVELPVGNGGYYAPVRITEQNLLSAPDSYFTVRYFRKSPSPPYDISKKDDPVNLKKISDCEYWTIDRDAGNSTSAYVWLSYDDQRSCGVTDPSKLRVARWDGNEWTNGGGTPSGTYVMSGAYFDNFGPFTLSSADAGLQRPLPLTFLSFKVSDNNGKAYLQWTTANEVNNDHFEVQYSNNGKAFYSVGDVYPNTADISAVKNYSYVDQRVSSAKVYYRIRQLDADGTSTYSSIASYQGSDDRSDWSVAYNRSSKTCTVFFNLPKELNVDASIYSASGQLIVSRTFVTDCADRRQFVLNISPGVYFVRLSVNKDVWVKQFIVQ